jgi:alkylation response protein AidB-like acyl-CoA dehydrogenase
MDFALSTEHEILRNSVRNFSIKEIQPLARGLDEREEFSPDLTRAMGKLGLFGMSFQSNMEVRVSTIWDI